MERRSYQEFSQRLAEAARRGRRPLRVMFELTYRCDFHCGHCYVPASFRKEYAGKELGTDQVFEVLSQLKDAGCLYLGLTGGEPLLRHDILDILAFARDNGFITTLYTNAHGIDAGMARELKRLAVSKVDLTLPAVSESAFRAVTRVKGARERVFAALRHLEKAKVAHSLKTCVLEANQGEVGSIRALARQRGLPLRVADALFPSWDGSVEPMRLGGGHPKSQPVPGDCGRQRSRAGGVFFCGAGLTQAAITPGGELKLCLMIGHPKTDILRRGFKGAWASLNKLACRWDKTAGSPCGTCGERPSCGWCPAVSWIMKGNLTECARTYEHHQAQGR